jgi:hypothetical protein
MSPTAAITPITKQNPFDAARLTLISALLTLKAPAAYPSSPSPADHEDIAAHIREAAQIFDGWLAAIGSEVRDNAVTSINRHMFSGSFLGAVDGNETGVCEEQAEALREYASERRTSMRRAS